MDKPYRVVVWNHEENKNKEFEFILSAQRYSEELSRLGFLTHIEYRVGQRWFRI